YASPNAAGSVLSQGTISANIGAAPSPTPLTVTLGGVVNSIALTLAPGPTPGATSDPYIPVGNTGALTVAAQDASGSTIIGPYANPVHVSVPSSSGILVNGGSSLSLATSPPSPLQVSYAGGPTYLNAPTLPVTISASAATGPGQSTPPPGTTATLYPTSTTLEFDVTPPDAPQGVLSLIRNPSGTFYYGWLTCTGPGGSCTGPSGGIGSFDPSSGTTLTAAVPYIPGSMAVDPVHGGLWVADGYGTGAGSVQCYPAVGASPTPFPLPTASPVPVGVVVDNAGNLWFEPGSPTNTIGEIALSGVCSIAPSSVVTWRTLAPSSSLSSPGTAIAGTMAGTPSGPIGGVWISDMGNPEVFRIAGPSVSPSPIPLPNPSPGEIVPGLAVDGSGNLFALGETTVSSLYELPAGGTSFSLPPLATFPGSPAIYLGSYTASSGSTLAAGVLLHSGWYLGLYYDATALTPPFTLFPLPQMGLECDGVNFDASGMPWMLCTDGTKLRFYRFVLTSSWALFAPATLGWSSTYLIGIGGAPPSTTFTAACTGALSPCSMLSPTLPDDVQVTTSGATGTGTLTVTGSDGRSQSVTVTVTPSPPAG
ncbi:MAG: NHL repeat-containing protein, partial [Vulcanimicrobiaceae bacterium]